jgi:hypothetical protein
MKKINVTLTFTVVILIGVLPMITQAGAETMNFKLVSMIEKRETVKVTQTEGVIIGVLDRKGLSIFENGEVATTSCRGTFDTKKGFQGYSSIIFEDGSTLLLAWKGPTSQSRPAGGKFREYTIAVEYADGTGRFKGVKGNGIYTAKEPQWDDDYKAKGFAYYQFTGTYTLPSK